MYLILIIQKYADNYPTMIGGGGSRHLRSERLEAHNPRLFEMYWFCLFPSNQPHRELCAKSLSRAWADSLDSLLVSLHFLSSASSSFQSVSMRTGHLLPCSRMHSLHLEKFCLELRHRALSMCVDDEWWAKCRWEHNTKGQDYSYWITYESLWGIRNHIHFKEADEMFLNRCEESQKQI